MNILLLVVAVIWLPAMLYMGVKYGIGLAKSNYRAYPPSLKGALGAVPGFLFGFVMGLLAGLGAPALYWEVAKEPLRKVWKRFRSAKSADNQA